MLPIQIYLTLVETSVGTTIVGLWFRSLLPGAFHRALSALTGTGQLKSMWSFPLLWFPVPLLVNSSYRALDCRCHIETGHNFTAFLVSLPLVLAIILIVFIVWYILLIIVTVTWWNGIPLPLTNTAFSSTDMAATSIPNINPITFLGNLYESPIWLQSVPFRSSKVESWIWNINPIGYYSFSAFLVSSTETSSAASSCASTQNYPGSTATDSTATIYGGNLYLALLYLII